MRPIAILLAACAVSVCFSDSLHAQRRIPYSSRRPAVSPWVSLSHSANGGVNSYLGMVRPRQELIQFADQTMRFAESQRIIDRQAGYEFTELQQSVERGVLQQRPAGPSARMPARCATFMNYSRYYPQSQYNGPRSGGANFNRNTMR